MVKATWVGIAFVGGIALGVLGARTLSDDRAGSAAPARDIPARQPAAIAVPMDSPAPQVGAAPHVAPAPSSAGAGNPPVEAPMALTTPPPETSSAGDSAATQRIEVGAAFHQLIDRPSAPGFPNEFGDAHRTLEGETRDDSWSYSLEAEIRNSLTAEVSAGNIKVDFLECRATICEIRLSASDAHANALNAWSENTGAYPWSRRLQSVGMSMAIVNRETHGLWIFRKAPK